MCAMRPDEGDRAGTSEFKTDRDLRGPVQYRLD